MLPSCTQGCYASGPPGCWAQVRGPTSWTLCLWAEGPQLSRPFPPSEVQGSGRLACLLPALHVTSSPLFLGE